MTWLALLFSCWLLRQWCHIRNHKKLAGEKMYVIKHRTFYILQYMFYGSLVISVQHGDWRFLFHGYKRSIADTSIPGTTANCVGVIVCHADIWWIFGDYVIYLVEWTFRFVRLILLLNMQHFLSTKCIVVLLWPPYIADADIIFLPCSFFFFFFLA